jgi:hypothetical protein
MDFSMIPRDTYTWRANFAELGYEMTIRALLSK